MREAIDLIEEIHRIQPSSRILFTTYKYNQSFFEKYVFSRFRGKSLPLVLMDYYEYQHVLRESGKSTLAGTRYLIDSVRIPERTFHPKLVVACSDKEIKIIVGSANLTHAGFSKNAEICSVETIAFDKRSDCPILIDACGFLKSLKERVESKRFKQELGGLLEKIDIGSHSADVKKDNVHLVHNLQESILDQVREVVQEEITRVTVISPFFSQELALYDRIAEDFSENMEFVIQPGGNNFPVKTLENWDDVEKLRFLSIAFKDNRDLHGKAILFHTNSEVFALIGSANFTESALMYSTGNGGNVEASLLLRAQRRYFEYLFDSSLLSLRTIGLKDIKPVSSPSIANVASDFRILEANVFGDRLNISFDYKSAGNSFNVRIHVNNLEREISLETNSNDISIPLSSQDLRALTGSSIVSLSIKDGERQFSSDLRLIHNPLYFPDQFSALNSVIDEDERTWLFRILSRYAALPSLSYVMPIIERLESYGFFELDPRRKEEILWLLQARLANIRPYSASEQFTSLIDRLKQRHETRMKNAMKLKRVDQLQTVISSFLMINKLCVWLVRKDYQSVDYLRWVRLYVEVLFLKKYIALEDPNQNRMVADNKLLAYVIILSHIVDFYQRESPKFRGTGRNYVKEAFETTFVDAIQLLRNTGEEKLKSDLQSLAKEFSDVSPEIDYSVATVIGRLNGIIKNVNLNKSTTYPLFSL
jgi:hypothetical protein